MQTKMKKQQEHPTISQHESAVRSYCRAFPATFVHAKGSIVTDDKGSTYLDMFAGAGALNYGHNPEPLKSRLVDYLAGDGITHALDMTTGAKVALLEGIDRIILQPRKLNYKVMFPGPTGTNAVEAALKIARKATGRSGVVAFTNGFHGMTLGALSVTGNAGKRAGAGIPLNHVTRLPFENYQDVSSGLVVFEQMLQDFSSGLDKPAAVIVETIQAEGGVRVASRAWLRRLREITKEHDILLIVDDIQVGCGRTGDFFSFERAGIRPDIVCLSKSLSGYGLPFALVLLDPAVDVFEPGEHNGTFRGFNPAFVTALAALETYWRDDELSAHVARRARMMQTSLDAMATTYGGVRRGRGMIQGIEFDDPHMAAAISKTAYQHGVIVETAGAQDEVLKLLPPLTTPDAQLRDALDRIDEAARVVCNGGTSTRRGPRTRSNGVEVTL